MRLRLRRQRLRRRRPAERRRPPPSGDARDCADGEFDNDEECEACYFPGDLTLGTAVCDRYEDACHAACDGGADAHSHTDSHAEEE